jgi:dTDP-4-dehydrorhamnose reductase
MERVAIFGSAGQLGSDLVDVLQSSGSLDVCPLTHADADCTDAQAVREAVLRLRPSIIINSAAYVRVDDCEDHASEAFNVNAIGALNIARACAEIDALSVYISTDFVFDGTKETPYVESDRTNPINVYGTSKLAGELLVRQSAPRWLIVRVSSLFGKTGAHSKGGNFIDTVIAKAKKGEPLRVVDDINISPTYTRDVAEVIRFLFKEGLCGIIHSANRGRCSWYEFAKAALDLCGVSAELTKVSSSMFRGRALRPKNSVLNSSERRVNMPGWHDALARYLIEKGHASVLDNSIDH